MIKFEILAPRKDYFFEHSTIKPLSMNSGLTLDSKYFDEVSLLSKVPSFSWHNDTEEIIAFILNSEVFFKDIGLGLKVIGYQSVCKNISFIDMLSRTIKGVENYNKECAYTYGYIFFDSPDVQNIPLLKQKLESIGFERDTDNRYILKIEK